MKSNTPHKFSEIFDCSKRLDKSVLQLQSQIRERQWPQICSLIMQCMKRLAQCLLAIMAIQSICLADVTKLPAADQKVLRDISRFHEIHSVTNLPPIIFALCVDGKGRLAEPGQNWEATDVITDDKLPTKRLIWAFTDGDYYVVHYERGGYAHSFHVLVAKLKVGDSKPSFIWRGVGFEQLKDFKAFLDAVANNSLDDKLDYAH
jgi:hypothetical protein